MNKNHPSPRISAILQLSSKNSDCELHLHIFHCSAIPFLKAYSHELIMVPACTSVKLFAYTFVSSIRF